jgi:hypothetical protein
MRSLLTRLTPPATICAAAFLSLGARSAPRLPLPASPVPHDTTYVVMVRADDMMSMLKQTAFADGGVFYPCRIEGAKCAQWGHDIALSDPLIKTDADRIFLSVHIKGSYPISQFFAPVVEGTLNLSAVPVVRDNLIRMSQTDVTSGGGDATFNGFVGLAHQQIAQYVEQNVKFDLAQHLALSTGDPSMPPPRLSGLACVDPKHLTLTSAATQPAPAAVVINVHLVTPPQPKSVKCA